MLKKAVIGFGLLLTSTFSSATPHVNAYLSGDCAGATVRLADAGGGRFDFVALFSDRMNAKAGPGQSVVKDCTIDWNLDLPPNMRFEKLDLKAGGNYDLGDRGSATSTIEHIVDFDHDTYDDVVFSSEWGDPSVDSYDFYGTISRSQLSAPSRQCGANIKMLTHMTVEAHSQTLSNLDAKNRLRRASVKIDGQYRDVVRICGIQLTRC